MITWLYHTVQSSSILHSQAFPTGTDATDESSPPLHPPRNQLNKIEQESTEQKNKTRKGKQKGTIPPSYVIISHSTLLFVSS
ncbi:hypothetical protein C7212DRAFT_334101, partial [Tuber magnatum]